MISTLVKTVMRECNLQQKALAEVLGVSVDRVKSLTSGRVQKLTPDESQALVSRLGIHPTWLITQEGPMFRHDTVDQDETQDEFVERMQAIKLARAIVDGLSIDAFSRLRLGVVMSGDPAADAPLIEEAVKAGQFPVGDAPSTAHEPGQQTQSQSRSQYIGLSADLREAIRMIADELYAQRKHTTGDKFVELVESALRYIKQGRTLERADQLNPQKENP